MTTWFVVPCAARKRSRPAPARLLYDSENFRHTLAAAEAEAAATVRDLGTPAAVLILSARHGLVDPETVLAPYDTTVGDPGAVDAYDLAAQMVNRRLGAGHTFCALLPRAYRDLLDDAALLTGAIVGTSIPVFDLFEAAGPGIGYQRRVRSALIREAAVSRR